LDEYVIFTQTNSIRSACEWLKMLFMLRKITLLFLLCLGLYGAANAQVIDSVSIYLPYGTDTTCPGIQLTFTAVQSNDTFSTTQYKWYTDNVYTGVSIDTFYTTALVDGDSVYCEILYTNSLGVLDSFKSNVIIVHRSNTIPPRVLVSLTTGSNPGCGATPLTFTAYPVNGGSAPTYQWMVNGTPLAGEDSSMITRYFNAGDTVSCMMVSNSPCASPTDTAFSGVVPIIHDSLTATDSIYATRNPICFGTLDTFTAIVYAPGFSGYSIEWYVDTASFPSAVGPVFITDSLHDGSKVYCVLTDPEPCVVNHTTISNIITITSIPLQSPSLSVLLTEGANPGCLDSAVTFTGTYTNFGTAPDLTWFVNGVPTATNTATFTHTYNNGDLLTFQVATTDNGCYYTDTVNSPAIILIRDSTPVAPLVSLIGDLLVANNAGAYTWYYNGNVIPGAIAQTYHPLVLGYYYAIRDSGNCPSAPSNIIYISLVGVDNINHGNVKLYPNPTTGILNFDFGGQAATLAMDVFNIYGQGMLHEEIDNKSHYETDLSYLPEGNYFVVLRDADGSKETFKIQIKR
jgi:hypothetical protein